MSVDRTSSVILGSAIAHLLEYVDTGHPFDRIAAMDLIGAYGLDIFAEAHPELLPTRRDGISQADRFRRRDA